MENFWNKVNKTETCWLWTGARTGANGYGRIRVQGVLQVAHRISWFIHHGTIPAGMEIDHLCAVKHCVNPAHLEPVTKSENNRRGAEGRRSPRPFSKSGRARNPDGTFVACPQGHPYAGDNLYVRPSGFRSCRQCNREGVRRVLG